MTAIRCSRCEVSWRMEDGTHCWACGMPGELGALLLGYDGSPRAFWAWSPDEADAALRESTRGRP